MARYVTNGPVAPWVVPALMPAIPNSPVSTTWGWARILGQPGTQVVPAPKPGVHSVSPNPFTQPSYCAPDGIRPALYQAVPDWRWRHVPSRPLEIMPVPAVNLYNMPGVAQRSRKVGGVYQVQQPGTVQRWPNLLGRLAGGGRPGAGPLPPPPA